MCHELIANMELVMKPTPLHYCHLSCFRCVTCQRQLQAGDLYSVNPDHGWPYCQIHTMDAMPQQHQHVHHHPHQQGSSRYTSAAVAAAQHHQLIVGSELAQVQTGKMTYMITN